VSGFQGWSVWTRIPQELTFSVETNATAKGSVALESIARTALRLRFSFLSSIGAYFQGRAFIPRNAAALAGMVIRRNGAGTLTSLVKSSGQRIAQVRVQARDYT